MANHKSAIKRIRANAAKRALNRYQHKTVRNAIRAIRLEKSATEASSKLPKIVSMIDRLAKKNIIHKNKAGNIKSKLAKFIVKLK